MKLLSQIQFLSENEMDRIFDGALDIVKSISMQVRHVKMLQILHDYGCEFDMVEQRVRFPMAVLQNLLDGIEKQKVAIQYLRMIV
jgi:trimethylamine:corrinoid methyltransferase-like protein